MKLALNNGKAYIKGKLVKASILVKAGKIEAISPKKFHAQQEIDCRGKIILPGAIDVHVHFREPGLEYKEDFFSGSMAALSGGITTAMDMPNTNPATTTATLLEEKRERAAKEAFCNMDFYMAATRDNLEEIAKGKDLRAVKVYYGSTTGNILFNEAQALRELFRLAKLKGFMVVVHAEDEETIKKNAEKYKGVSDASVHAKIRNEEAEAKAISAVLELQKEIGNKLHIAHISSARGVALVQKAKKGKNGKLVTSEVTPHHLFLDAGSYKKLGYLVKCNPSIKEKKHRNALWKAFKSGAIEIVATDHAPHSPEEKAKPYSECPSGIPGVETMLPLLLDAVFRKKVALKRVMEAVAEKPAQLFGWKGKGFIAKGFDADLVIVNPKKGHEIVNEKLFTKARYSPWAGQKLKGSIENTIVGGRVFG